VKLSDTPLVTNQVRYSLFYRRPQDNGTLTFCRKNDIVLTAYSPLRLGDLSHPVVIEADSPRGDHDPHIGSTDPSAAEPRGSQHPIE